MLTRPLRLENELHQAPWTATVCRTRARSPETRRYIVVNAGLTPKRWGVTGAEATPRKERELYLVHGLIRTKGRHLFLGV